MLPVSLGLGTLPCQLREGAGPRGLQRAARYGCGAAGTVAICW
jgi:hypothetical protein